MCGIAGIIGSGMSTEPSEIAAMCDVISYRGPDDYGYLAYQSDTGRATPFKNVFELDTEQTGSSDVMFGHRRLAILDLSEHGRQPISYADGLLWMVYNGEIYNYLEIREELKQKGHSFRTDTDSEVILAAWLEWGEACLHKLNGMWSFAILDTREKTVFCARDRLGIKPFHYSLQQNKFTFASEIKQILMLPWIETGADDGSFFDYLAFRAYGGDRQQTYFKNIFQLKAGHCLKINLNRSMNEQDLTPIRWWNIDPSQKLDNPDDASCAEQYRELLIDSVRLRLRADVPIGTCLSGGLDSSSIVCTVNRILKAENPDAVQKTFTVTSEDPNLDEREYAQAVIDATTVQPAFTMPSADSLLNAVNKLIWHHDEPFGNTSIFAGWSVFELARREGVTVTLDGQGPDEMIGGYFSAMMDYRMAQDIASGKWWSFIRDYRARQELHRVPLQRIAKLLMLEIPGFAFLKRHAGDIAIASDLLNTDFFEKGRSASTYLEEQRDFNRVSGGIFDRKQYHSTFSGSLPGILRNVDRNSMAFSIESRVPFLDHRLVEFCFSLPAEMKLRAGKSKWILREAMKNILPPKVLNRKNKIGFATAEEKWIKGNGQNLFKEVFSQIPNDAPYKGEVAREMLDGFLEKNYPYNRMIWRIFHCELWRRQFIENPPASPLQLPAETLISGTVGKAG